MSDSFVLLAWVVILWATGLAGIPIAFRLLHRLPDRGLTLARPLGLLVAGYAFWLLNMLGYLQNGAVSAGLAVGLIVLIGALWLGRAGWADLADALRLHWRPIVAGEILFLAAFCGGVWLRAHNPDIVATEKPMELMLINSVVHSPVFPPQDAWLSGYSISYYYFGYVLVALLTHLSGATTAVSFNLSLATWLALSAGAVYGVVLNIVGAIVRTDRGPARAKAPANSDDGFWVAARLPALLAPVFVIVAGNLYGVVRGLYVNGALADTTLVVPYSSIGQTLEADGSASAASTGPQFGAVEFWTWLDTQGISGPLASTVTARPNLDLGWWWWFQAARITNDRDLTGAAVSANVITEFPAFSFILGDLHPHVLALPFDLLAVGVSLTWFLMGFEPEARHPEKRFVLGSAVVIGALGFLNTWDLPVQLVIVSAAFIVGRAQRDGWPAVRAAWRAIVLPFGALIALCAVLYVPFYLAFQSQAGGVLPNLVYPTRFQHTIVFFSHVLLSVTLVVIGLVRREGARFRWRAALGWSTAVIGLLVAAALVLTLVRWFNPVLADEAFGPLGDLSTSEAVARIITRRLVDSWSTLVPAGMIGAAVVLVGAWTLPRRVAGPGAPAPLAFALILIAVGALLVVGPEWLYLRDMFGVRMNTVFKLYFQAWVLWGVAGWVGLWWLWRTATRRARVVIGATTAVAVGCGLVYTLVAAASVTLTEPPTLDGLAYFARTYPDDWAAIQWLEREAEPGDVIVEGVSGQYWMDGIYSRVSMATGLPTVLGWPGHEGQWRGAALDDVLAEREADVERLYTTRDPAELSEILARYDVRYVIVGRVEQTKYLVGPAAPPLRKFDDALARVFESGQLIIYERTP